MPVCSEERDMRVTSMLDLASAAEGLNCKKILHYSDEYGKNFAIYMSRNSVMKTQNITVHSHTVKQFISISHSISFI